MKTVQFNSEEHPRHPRGVPTGGRFASKSRDEITEELSVPGDPDTFGDVEDDVEPDAMDDFAHGSGAYVTLPGGRSPARLNDPAHQVRWLPIVEKSSWAYARRANVEYDDLMQTVAVAMHNYDREGQLNGKSVAGLRTLADSLARNESRKMRASTYDVKAGDMRAWRLYQEEMDAFVIKHSREPSYSEQDAIAEEIRMRWEPQKRPSIGFHRYSTTQSIDQTHVRTSGDDARPLSDVLEDESSNAAQRGTEWQKDQADKFEDMVGAAQGRQKEVVIRAHGANAIAEMYGVPGVTRGTISESKATRLRAALKDRDMGDAAVDFLAGKDDALDPVWSAFGEDIDDDGKKGWASVMASSPHLANGMADLLIAGATKERVRS